jgi:hypothetical protein
MKKQRKQVGSAKPGVRHRSSRGPLSRPVVLKLSVEMATAESQDVVGSADSPEHAGFVVKQTVEIAICSLTGNAPFPFTLKSMPYLSRYSVKTYP